LETRPKRSDQSPYDTSGGNTTYVHMLINQRTVPLGKSIPECGKRDDGWCELQTFIKFQKHNVAKASYDASCFGNYSRPGYGDITDGAIPVPSLKGISTPSAKSSSGGINLQSWDLMGTNQYWICESILFLTYCNHTGDGRMSQRTKRVIYLRWVKVVSTSTKQSSNNAIYAYTIPEIARLYNSGP